MCAPAEAFIPCPSSAQKLLAADATGALTVALSGRRPSATTPPAAQRRNLEPTLGRSPFPMTPPCGKPATRTYLVPAIDPLPPGPPARRVARRRFLTLPRDYRCVNICKFLANNRI